MRKRGESGEVIQLPSPLLHPRAADALLLAASPLPSGSLSAKATPAEIVPVGLVPHVPALAEAQA
jgi:hypothetical protein